MPRPSARKYANAPSVSSAGPRHPLSAGELERVDAEAGMDRALGVRRLRALVHQGGDPLRQGADLLEVLGRHPALAVRADAMARATAQPPLHVLRARRPQRLGALGPIEVASEPEVVAVAHGRATGAGALAVVLDHLQEPGVGELARVVAGGRVRD